jgi:hypothetical protein
MLSVPAIIAKVVYFIEKEGARGRFCDWLLQARCVAVLALHATRNVLRLNLPLAFRKAGRESCAQLGYGISHMSMYPPLMSVAQVGQRKIAICSYDIRFQRSSCCNCRSFHFST